MTDPLTVAASVVGVTVPALHGTRLLLDDIQSIIDAPNALAKLKTDLLSLDMALNSLQGMKNQEWELLGETVVEQSKNTITNCTKACDMFRTNLKSWTRHSDEGKLSWQDRANVGLFKQRQIQAISHQLQACMISINSVVGIATLYGTTRSSHITENIKKALAAHEAEISDAIASTHRQLAEVYTSLRELRLGGAEQDHNQTPEDMASTVKQVEEERKTLNSSRKLLEELLSKATEEALSKAVSESQNRSTHVIFGNQGKGYQIGISHGPIHGNIS